MKKSLVFSNSTELVFSTDNGFKNKREEIRHKNSLSANYLKKSLGW